MTEWHIKDISNMTQISVRMLRHYDKIGLLKPSYRAANGYRCYTPQDLAKLQQIIALKYFGFSLANIKAILQKHQNIYAHLQAQQHILKKQTIHLQQVCGALEDILQRLSPSQVPNWNDVITLIERFQMSGNLRDKLKKSWAGQKLNATQFEEYLLIYEKFPKEFAARDQIIEQINKKEFGDADGPDGVYVASFLFDFAKKTKEIFSKQIKFSSSLMESIQSGKLTQLELIPEGVAWVRQAWLSYWVKRWDKLYDAILENLASDPTGKMGKKLANEWTGLLDEYFSIGSRAFLNGIIVWNDLARQQHDFKALKALQSPQEMVKQLHVKLLFNPEATSWISRALETHL